MSSFTWWYDATLMQLVVLISGKEYSIPAKPEDDHLRLIMLFFMSFWGEGKNGDNNGK